MKMMTQVGFVRIVRRNFMFRIVLRNIHIIVGPLRIDSGPRLSSPRIIGRLIILRTPGLLINLKLTTFDTTNHIFIIKYLYIYIILLYTIDVHVIFNRIVKSKYLLFKNVAL